MSKKILVVDDDKDILGVIDYILKEEGYTVTSSTTSAILSKLGKIKPDLILLDCWLPEGFGDDLCRDLKSNEAYKHIPVIMVSAVNELNFIAKKCNADGYIEKPFDIEHLVGMVKRHCPV